MKKTILSKKIIITTTIMMIFGVFLVCVVRPEKIFAKECEHENGYHTETIYPTCEKEGEILDICDSCGIIINKETISPLEHEWTAEWVSKTPFLGKFGEKTKQCLNCGKLETTEFRCEHEHTETVVVTEATCLLEGVERDICKTCNIIVSERTIEKKQHSYGNWEIIKEASPGVSGLKRKTCHCGKSIEESYEFSMAGTTSIYIPGTGINHVMNFGGYNQASVDAYNIVYVEQDEPWILGHKGRGLGNIYKAKVGQKMYISVNGIISEYEIFISEYATVDETGTFITGHTTGTCIQNLFGYGVLHIYTCYGSGNGRWIVLARKL